MQHKHHQQQLIHRYASNKASSEELEVFFHLLQQGELDDVLLSEMDKEASTLEPNTKTSPSIPIYKRTWWRYTAASAILILAIGSGIYYLNHQSYKSNKSSQITVQTKEAVQEIPPGTNKAILTFSNGTQKELGFADNGLQLQSDAVLLTTPNGGQYQAVLPDGSNVWLNAASSIQFPSKFTDKERRVEVTGEVYFEIAKDAKRPFKVSGGEQEIEVLGTSFNMNVYDDEPVKKTTLLTGSIKITNNKQTVILQPNQQAQIINYSLLITNSSSDVLAWKNGLFNFSKTDIQTVMRQISRWYDVDVIYEKEIPSISISGDLGRDLSLTQLLNVLGKMEVKSRIEGRKLIISN